jgi:putative flippase GtrA
MTTHALIPDVQPAPHQRVESPVERSGSQARRQITRFIAIGVASTAAYLLFFSVLRTAIPAGAANGLALALTAFANTAANRRLTFDVHGRQNLARDHIAGLLAFGLALAITTGSLALLGAVASGASRAVELIVLIAANAVATAARFLLLRAWLVPRAPATLSAPSGAKGATR